MTLLPFRTTKEKTDHLYRGSYYGARALRRIMKPKFSWIDRLDMWWERTQDSVSFWSVAVTVVICAICAGIIWAVTQ